MFFFEKWAIEYVCYKAGISALSECYDRFDKPQYGPSFIIILNFETGKGRIRKRKYNYRP
jgi:hypothetical protein